MKCGCQSSFLLVKQNNIAPQCLDSLFLIGNCLAKSEVCFVKQQVKMLTVNASLQVVVSEVVGIGIV